MTLACVRHRRPGGSKVEDHAHSEGKLHYRGTKWQEQAN